MLVRCKAGASTGSLPTRLGGSCATIPVSRSSSGARQWSIAYLVDALMTPKLSILGPNFLIIGDTDPSGSYHLQV